MKAIQAAIAGYGFSGSTFHAPFFKVMEEFEVVSVFSSKEKRVKQDFPNAQVTQDWQSILSNPDIELVVVATPNRLHFQMTKEALEAGKHVILEKPMVPTVQEAEQLTQLAKKKGVMLSVYQNRRWDGNFLTIKKLIDEGTIGEVNTYEAHYDRYDPAVGGWRQDDAEPASGMVYDLSPHLIDQALVLFGMPEAITADVQKQRQGTKVDDYFHIILKYGTRRVILHSSLIAMSEGAKYKVHGSKATFMKWGEDPQEGELLEGKKPEGAEWGMDRLESYGTLYTENGSQNVVTLPGDYRQYYQQVYECIRSGAPCPVPGEEAVRTIRLIEAALQSSNEKRTIDL